MRHLVELHGGTVEASSPGEGQGATFSVHLPLISARRPEEAAGQAPQLDGLRILLVDDDVAGRDAMAALLQNRGARVTAASTSAEALEAMRRERPDVLLSDIEMPGTSPRRPSRRTRTARTGRRR